MPLQGSWILSDPVKFLATSIRFIIPTSKVSQMSRSLRELTRSFEWYGLRKPSIYSHNTQYTSSQGTWHAGYSTICTQAAQDASGRVLLLQFCPAPMLPPLARSTRVQSRLDPPPTNETTISNLAPGPPILVQQGGRP